MTKDLVNFAKTHPELVDDAEAYVPDVPETVDPNLTRGEVKCMECSNEWVARAPKDSDFLRCPKCGAFKGHFLMPRVRQVDHWHCECGNNLFMCTTNSLYCPNCGTDQEFRPHD